MVRAAPRTPSGTDDVQAEGRRSVLLSIVPTDMDMETEPPAAAGTASAEPGADTLADAATAEAARDDAMAKAITEILVDPGPEPLAVQETVVTRPEVLNGGRAPSTLVPSEDAARALAATEPLALPHPSEGLPQPAPARRGAGWLLAMGGGLLLGGGAVSVVALLALSLAGAGAAVAGLLLVGARGGPPDEVAIAPAAEIALPAAEAPAAENVTPATDASAGGSEEVASAPEKATPAPSSGSPERTGSSERTGTSGDSAPSARAPSAGPGTANAAPSPAPSAPAPSAPAPSAPAPTPAPATTAPAPAPAPVPAPAPAAASPGLIATKILSDPPAALLTVDGQSQGRTPAKLQLEPGTHQITLTAGASKGSFTIEVSPEDNKFCYGLSGKKVVRTGCD